MKIKKYGWHRDMPDPRDLKYVAPHMASLPDNLDMRDQMPDVYDQGNLGSCTAHATSAIIHFLEIKEQKPKVFQPARLAVYYNTRVLEGTVNYDSGASIRNSIKSVVKWGFCDENLWPYQISKFKRKPNQRVYKESLPNRVTQYETVDQDLNTLKTCLAAGNLFTFGFSVYDSFESDEVSSTGIMTMPHANENILGGHAITAVGYDDHKQWFIIRNSWGHNWGDKGYFYMPYAFIQNHQYCDDFWTIKSV